MEEEERGEDSASCIGSCSFLFSACFSLTCWKEGRRMEGISVSSGGLLAACHTAHTWLFCHLACSVILIKWEREK